MAISEYALTDLDSVKKFMSMTGAVSDTDDLLESLISRTSTLMESYMGRNILTREYTEYHNGGGVYALFTRQGQITTVSGIWDSSDWEWTDDTLVDADDYTTVDDNYIVLKNTTFNDYIQNCKIIYTAGYSSVPSDIQQACITEVSRMYKNKNSVDITSKTLSDGSVSFYDKGFLPLTIITLNKYKRVNIV